MAYLKHAVEIPLLLSFFSILLTDSIYSNQVIYRTCYITLGYNKTECAQLGTVETEATQNLEKLVEPYANYIRLVKGTMENVVSTFICFFIAPWSDKIGRKPVVLLCLVGYILSGIINTMYSYIDTLSPWYLMIGAIPFMLVGGISAFLTVFLSYITDVTSEESRGMRMGVFDGILALGIFAGSITGSYLFYAVGYGNTFLIATIFLGLSFLYIVFFIEESLQQTYSENRIQTFFDTSNVVDMFKTTLRERDKNNRSIILLTIGAVALCIFIINADFSVFTLYLRSKFQWTLEQCNWYGSITSLVNISGSIIGVYIFHKILKVPESVLMLCAVISTMNSALVSGFATKSEHLYFALAVRCLGSLITPMGRSLISKRVTQDEVAKVFSVIMAVQSLLGLASSPLYVTIYNATVATDPSVFCFVTAGLYGACIVLVIIIIILQNAWRFRRYQPINDDVTEIEENDSPVPVN